MFLIILFGVQTLHAGELRQIWAVLEFYSSSSSKPV